jgi:hypothetical protein
MAYTSRLNQAQSISKQDAKALVIEFDLLRRELDEIRANFRAVLVKLDSDAGVTDTDFASTLTVAGSSVAALTSAPRRFTAT